MSVNNADGYEEIDEAEEEALLKSDDENDAAARARAALKLSQPTVEVNDDSFDEQMPFAATRDENLVDGGETDEAAEDDEEDGDEDDDEEGDNGDDFDETDQAIIEYKKLLQDIERNQYAYDKYVRLCELSHKTDDLDLIRNAYNMFSEIYPLAPEIWLKYLNIEIDVAVSPKELEAVEKLFRKALRDYYSVELALEFISFATKLPNPDGVWAEILGVYGLHCTQGQLIFKKYRDYINKHNIMSIEEKRKAIIRSFIQELRVPIQNMEESYIEFKVYYEKNMSQITDDIEWNAVEKNSSRAKEHLRKIFPFEQKLEMLEKNLYKERYEVYRSYIKEADKFLDENILQTIYERMVADCCLNVDSWLAYIDFIEYRDEFGRPDELDGLPLFQQDAIDVSRRALRNCTWSEKLYIRQMHLLEKLGKPREVIQEILESSMSAGFQTAEPAVAIWMEYLTYLRRHTDWKNEGECDILRKNFTLCWTILGQQWGVLADCNCEILQFWGRLEYGPLGDEKKAKELWTTVMESSENATKTGLWIEFIQMEMRHDLESARRLFSKALHTPGLDNPLVLVSAWQRFERCNGTIKSLNLCAKECEGFVQLIVEDKTKSVRSAPAKGTKRKHITLEAVPEKKVKISESDGGGGGSGGVVASSKVVKETKSEMAFKEHETQEVDVTKDHLRIFLSNLDYNVGEDDIRCGLPEIDIVTIDLIRLANGRSRGFAYLELKSPQDVDKALTLDRRPLNGRPVFISSVLRDKEKRHKFKYSEGVETTKLFLKSLPVDVTKEELEGIYSAFGKVKDVRLVYHKSGKFKNIAYVEYDNEDSANAAVAATNQLELRNHTVLVAISAPPPKPAQVPTSAGNKLLGVKRRPPPAKVFDQKPRISFIPNAVRKKFGDAASPMAAVNADPFKRPNANGTVSKTNDDFRKLLQKS